MDSGEENDRACVRDIFDEIDRKNDVHTAEIKELWTHEKKLLKDELLDEIIRTFRHGGRYPSPKYTDKTDSEKN